MVRKLVTSDLAAVLDLVRPEPSLNIWIIADIENYGLPTDFLEMWGAFRGNALQAVVLRFHQNYVAYSPDRVLPDGLVDVLRQAVPPVLTGAADTIQAMSDALGFGSLTLQYLAELRPGALRPYNGPPVEVAIATPAHAPELHDLAQTVSEFAGGSVDGWSRRLCNPRVRTYYIRQGSRIVSTASTNIECSSSAMIGAVMTHPGYRARGLASACMSKLCADLLRSGMVCCLSYHNPTAAGVYERLGFTVVSPWAIATRST